MAYLQDKVVILIKYFNVQLKRFILFDKAQIGFFPLIADVLENVTK